ncbi:MAG: helix-turn-helix transcriptional regulator [Armatimonadota bacterium]
MTRYDLARQFRLMLGTSPYRYLLMRRLEFARQRIHLGCPLVAVACEAGFADQAHLTRTFKSAFGLTPARYRALRADQITYGSPVGSSGRKPNTCYASSRWYVGWGARNRT